MKTNLLFCLDSGKTSESVWAISKTEKSELDISIFVNLKRNKWTTLSQSDKMSGWLAVKSRCLVNNYNIVEHGII